MKQIVVSLAQEHPKMVIAVAVLISIILGFQIPKIHIDTDPENMLPADEPVRLFHHEVTEEYGLHDMVVVGIVREDGVFRPETLERVVRLTEGIRDIEGVIDYDILAPTEVDDIFTTKEGILRVETLMEEAPETQAEATRILEQIKKNPVLRGKLASDDGKALAIFVPLETKEMAHKVATQIEALIAAEGGDEEYHIAGIPVAETRFGAEMFVQMAVYAPIAFVLIFFVMLYFFRSWIVVMAPMIVAMMSVTWTMGLLIGLGFTVHIMSSMIPIFLLPIAVLDSIHILSEFHHRYHGTGNMKRVIHDTMEELFRPMLFTSVTTAVGFSSLMLTPIPPVQVFGAFVAFGVGAAWILSITVIPAFAMLVPEEAMKKFGRLPEARTGMTAAMHFVRDFSYKHATPLVAVGALVFGASLYGLTKIEVNDNPVKWFKPGHPIRVADSVMNSHLSGTYVSYLALSAGEEGGLKEPEALRYIEKLQRKLEEHPNVGATTSIVDIVKKVRGELLGDPAEGIIPGSRDEVAQNLFLYEMSGGDPDDLFKLITSDADGANIWVQMRKGENAEVSSVIDLMDEYMVENPPPGLEVAWAGLPYINVVWQQKMVAGMSKALIGSFGVVLIMMVVLFRSIRIGILSMIPLTATIALVYAFIGYIGKPYDMPVAVLSSLTLGLSVDFAIHFLERMRELYREKGDYRAALEELFEAPAQAITRNILVIAIGFVPMFFANLVPYMTVGAFFFAIMLVSGFTTLFALPATLKVMNPAFLGGKRSS